MRSVKGCLVEGKTDELCEGKSWYGKSVIVELKVVEQRQSRGGFQARTRFRQPSTRIRGGQGQMDPTAPLYATSNEEDLSASAFDAPRGYNGSMI